MQRAADSAKICPQQAEERINLLKYEANSLRENMLMNSIECFESFCKNPVH